MTPIKLAKLVTARNKAFKSATPAERRVLVAKDVLARIKSGAYTPSSGNWVDIGWKSDDIAPSESLQKAILCDDVSCECCALGSLMLSNVSYQNNIETDVAHRDLFFCDLSPLPRYGDSKPIKDKSSFLKLFSKKQLALIEYTFERTQGMHNTKDLFDLGVPVDTIERAMDFFGDYDVEGGTGEYTSKELLVMIMDNIIENKGTFKP